MNIPKGIDRINSNSFTSNKGFKVGDKVIIKTKAVITNKDFFQKGNIVQITSKNTCQVKITHAKMREEDDWKGISLSHPISYHEDDIELCM